MIRLQLLFRCQLFQPSLKLGKLGKSDFKRLLLQYCFCEYPHDLHGGRKSAWIKLKDWLGFLFFQFVQFLHVVIAYDGWSGLPKSRKAWFCAIWLGKWSLRSWCCGSFRWSTLSVSLRRRRCVVASFGMDMSRTSVSSSFCDKRAKEFGEGAWLRPSRSLDTVAVKHCS